MVLPRLRFDLAELLMAASSDGIPAGFRARASDQPHVGVVLASAGYPEHVQLGAADHRIRCRRRRSTTCSSSTAARAKDKDRIVTAGGRVATVVGRGVDFAAAIDRAYAGVAAIQFEGVQVRRDIGRKALGGAR